MLDQSKTPLANALQRCAERAGASFHTPGHQRGQGISQRHRDLFGAKVFCADLPELPALDNLFAPAGVILEAQQLAAAAFGAEQTWFLANGSTCGIEAAILASCGPGEKIILPRNVHSSAISGLILSGAVPVYVSPVYSHGWQMGLGVEPAAIAAALRAHPDAKAVLLVSPTYYGICSDIEKIAALTHAHGIPLIVDEAHGPHFGFHPELPSSALAAGADIAVQSAHKVLSAFTQAAWMHVQGNLVDRFRLSQSLQLTQSTSPSYLLLGSLDAARHQMATEGFARMAQTLALADRAAAELADLPKLRVLQVGSLGFAGDRTRLTVDVSGLGLTGFAADDWLCAQGITAELPALRHLMFIISLGHSAADIDRLISAFRDLCEQDFPDCPLPSLSGWVTINERAIPLLSPREAFFAPKLSISADQAVGQICAETICSYPPGIPALLPGEVIAAEAIAHLKSVLRAGGSLTASDSRLKTIRVVEHKPVGPC
jgi:arginine decarboxylase